MGAAAATALAWFLYFLKKSFGRSAIDPNTQQFLDGLKQDVERIESAMNRCQADSKESRREIYGRLNSLEVAMARVDKT